MALEEYAMAIEEHLNEENQDLVNEQMLARFSSKIKGCFSTYVASVVTDMHGFPIHADVLNSMDENLLALSAVAGKRRIIDTSNFHRLIRPLNKNACLLVLLEKSRDNYANIGKFEDVVKNANPIN